MYLHHVHKKVNVFPLVNLLLEFYHGELLDLFRFQVSYRGGGTELVMLEPVQHRVNKD